MENTFEILSRPILPDEIEWKVQSYTKDKQKTIIVPYVTARCVMDRFDAAFGVENWKTEFKEVENGFICRLSVFIVRTSENFEWIYKEDGASKTDIEPVKGGISDSLKRAAHQWGLGRCLYSYPRVMLTGEVKYIDEKTIARLNKMVIAINNGEFTQNVVIL
jgi:hypothetical protein